MHEEPAGIAEFAEVEVFGLAVHVTEVNEGTDAHIVGFFVDFPRGHQLNAADGTEVATGGIAVAVTRAERAVLEAAHSGEAAGVVVAVEGQVTGFAVTATVTDVATQAEDEAFVFVKREVGAVAVTDFVVGVVRAGQGNFAADFVQATLGRQVGVVLGVFVPGKGKDAFFVAAAIFIEVVGDFARDVVAGVDFQGTEAAAEIDALVFGERVTEGDGGVQGIRRPVGQALFAVIGFAVIEGVVDADAVGGEIGVGEVEAVALFG